MDFEDISTNEKINYSIESSFYNVLEGTYNAYFDGSDTCCLFSSSNPEILKYKLNDHSSRKINKELRKLKVPKQEYIIQDYYDDDCNKYDAILICEIKEDIKYISLDFNNKIYEIVSLKI